jgi:hypothetical protein
MENIDFTDLEQKAEDIFADIDGVDLNKIKNRISETIHLFERNPDLFQHQQKVRNRIREIERKSLSKLGEKDYIPPRREGSKCSLCSIYESDVGVMVHLGQGYNICRECVVLIKDVIEERGE